MTANEITEVPTSWVRDYKPWVRTTASVVADLGTIRNVAATIGVDVDVYPLPQVAARLAKAEAWERIANEGRQVAAQEIRDAEAVAMGVEEPTPQALSAFVDVIERTRRWWDEQAMNIEHNRPGWDPPGVLAARRLARAERWAAGQLLNSATVGLYGIFAKAAAGAVERVAGVLPLPSRAWGAADPTALLPAETLATLQASERIFNAAWFGALYLRSMGMAGADLMADDSPPMALCFKQWATAIEHHPELRAVPKPLKLAFAVKGGWEPGLWLRADLEGVDQGPARKRYLPAFLVR